MTSIAGVARNHALSDMAGDAALRAAGAREAALRCSGEDQEYMLARAGVLEKWAERLLRDALKESRG